MRTQPTCTTTYTVTSNAGTSPATSCSGAVATNYSFTYAPGSVDIKQASLMITASSHTVTYGDAVPTITASFSAFKNSETSSSALSTQPTCTTTYTVKIGRASCRERIYSSAVATNYNFTYAPGSVGINQASVTITASSQTVTYGDAIPTITPSFSAFKNSETSSSALSTQPTCTTTYTVTSNAGTSPATSCSGA